MPERLKRSIKVLFVVLVIGYVGVVVRLLQLQVFGRERTLQLAERQYSRVDKITTERGVIYDRNYRELAISRYARSFFAVPREIKDRHKWISRVESVLGSLDAQTKKRLLKWDNFVWVARQLADNLAEQLIALELEGLYFTEEPMRIYPNGLYSAPLLGMVGTDYIGLEGIEYQFDAFLAGTPGFLIRKQDNRERAFQVQFVTLKPQSKVKTLVLTIDQVLQYHTYQVLMKYCQSIGANSAVAILMEPYSGEILAMAQYPSFDPNAPFPYQSKQHKNLPISLVYEPGSTIKVIVAAGLIQDKKIPVNEPLFTTAGKMSLLDIIVKSSNEGAAAMADYLGGNRLIHYFRLFGLGEKTGICLPGEERGKIPLGVISLDDLKFYAIGQGISVTPLQLINAFCAIANKGNLVSPRLVKRALSASGSQVDLGIYDNSYAVIDSDTSDKLKKILHEVVRRGTGKKAAIEGYSTAGKTGTAQIYDPITGSYSHSKVVASFVGFAPVAHPRLVGLVIFVEPDEESTGGTSAAPAFAEIMKKALIHLNVQPDEAQVPPMAKPFIEMKKTKKL